MKIDPILPLTVDFRIHVKEEVASNEQFVHLQAAVAVSIFYHQLAFYSLYYNIHYITNPTSPPHPKTIFLYGIRVGKSTSNLLFLLSNFLSVANLLLLTSGPSFAFSRASVCFF